MSQPPGQLSPRRRKLRALKCSVVCDVLISEVTLTLGCHYNVLQLCHVARIGDGVSHFLLPLGPAPAHQHQAVVLVVQVQTVAAPHTEHREHHRLS